MKCKATRRGCLGNAQGFTPIELLAVVAIVLLLTMVTLPALFTSKPRVLQAECADNLRQIGVGLNIYAAEANGYVPICGWAVEPSPWQTYEAARVMPGTTNVTRGFYSLGLLFRTGAVRDPRVFYCPGLAQSQSRFGFDYYATAPTGWPSTTAGSSDYNIRTGYNYYPQLRATSLVRSTSTGYQSFVSKLTYAYVTLEFGGTSRTVAPAKLTDLNLHKSITTDLVQDYGIASHRAYGSIAGINALFPDGHVAFQTPQQNPEAFDRRLWTNIGSDPTDFRIVMNEWQPTPPSPGSPSP